MLPRSATPLPVRDWQTAVNTPEPRSVDLMLLRATQHLMAGGLAIMYRNAKPNDRVYTGRHEGHHQES